MGRLKQFVIGLLFAGGVLGLKFYNKSGTHDEMKAKLVATCATDKACVAAVDQHFDTCFETAYDMGDRRHAASLDERGFLECFNQQAGVDHFTLGDGTAAAH